MIRDCVRSAIILFAVVFLFIFLAGCKEQSDYRFVLEKIPAHYKACFEKIVDIPQGPLSKEQLLQLVVDLRKSELRLQRCGRGAVRWVEAQHQAYYQHFN